MPLCPSRNTQFQACGGGGCYRYDSGLFELMGLPAGSGAGVGNGEVKDSSTDGKRGNGQSAIFVAKNRFAVFLSNVMTKCCE
jgi:hypothetical protein